MGLPCGVAAEAARRGPHRAPWALLVVVTHRAVLRVCTREVCFLPSHLPPSARKSLTNPACDLSLTE